jgi:glycosyltransferase involved in cell wall biosynthesis
MTTTLTAPEERLCLVAPDRAPIKVAILSTYPPRQCGIGSFCAEMYKSVADVAPDLDLLVCAVDRDGLRYGREVSLVLDQQDPASYRRCAADLAAAGVGAVLIQHEFGIYGGPDGAWITSFAAELSEAGVPYLVKLHTVPASPSRGQAEVLRRLCRDAAAVSIFSPAARLLAKAAGIRADRFETIPHGAPAELAPLARRRLRGSLRREVAEVLDELANASVVSTFGLVSPNKGLETAIAAVAEVARDVPNLHYVIGGATHPDVVRQYGEGYRHSLREVVAELGVGDRVHFLDFFLSDAEVAALLARSGVFLTPYRSRDQVSSGALTFALAAGCPVVSTSFFYAEDVLACGAGLLTEPGDAEAYTAALRRMLTEPGHLTRAAVAARAAGAKLLWPVVARRAADVIRTVARTRPCPRLAVPYQR